MRFWHQNWNKQRVTASRGGEKKEARGGGLGTSVGGRKEGKREEKEKGKEDKVKVDKEEEEA